MHQSLFTYNLSRPYPYRWFSWVVVLGGIVATAIFSVVSIAANGYDTALITIANPNDTETPLSPQWFQKRPWSIASKISPRCQDQVINVGSDVYTTELGFRHLLRATYSPTQKLNRPRRSIAYHYSALENCVVWRATIAAWSGGYNFSFLSTCHVYDNQTPVTVELWTYSDSIDRDLITYDLNWPSWFLWQSILTQAELLTCLTQLAVMSNGSDWTARSDYFFTSAGHVFSSAMATYGNETVTGRIGNQWLLDSDPSAWYQFNSSNHSNVSLSSWSTTPGLDALQFFDGFAINRVPYERPWNSSNPVVSLLLRADNIMRLLYSAVLSDFGQSHSWNMFASQQTFFNYVDAVNTMNQNMGDVSFMSTVASLASIDYPLPVFQFNETTRQDVSTLYAWSNVSAPSVLPSFFNTLYLCQIPKMKPTLSVIFTVIIADLVFLQALWVVFGFLIKGFLEHRDSTANYCSGCAKTIRPDHSVNALDFRPSDVASDGCLHEKKVMGPASDRSNDAISQTQRLSTEKSYHLTIKIPDETITLLPNVQRGLSDS